MRLKILKNGYSFGTKVLFGIIHFVTLHPLPDAAKLVFYRPNFYGAPAKRFTNEAMRGKSIWSVGDRELMATYVSKMNECTFCIGAHSATASMAYNDQGKVKAVLSNLDTAPVSKGLKATLRMLGKLTQENSVNADDIREVISAGVSREQIEDALAVSFAFNITNRLADAFGFKVLSSAGFDSGAKFLLKRGYGK